MVVFPLSKPVGREPPTLERPVEERTRDLAGWLDSLDTLSGSVSLCLSLVRDSALVTRETAHAAAEAAVQDARPMSENGYKVRLARTTVQRALMQAAGLNA